jgi:hypothetical protein
MAVEMAGNGLGQKWLGCAFCAAGGRARVVRGGQACCPNRHNRCPNLVHDRNRDLCTCYAPTGTSPLVLDKNKAAIQTDQDDPYRSAETEGTQNIVSGVTQID